MALVTKDMFDVKGWDAIEERCNMIEIKAQVDKNVQSFHTINISTAMKNLTQVGELLQLAYAGSKGFPCSVQVIEVLSNYQDLVTNSVITSSTFVDVTLKSLSFHKLALILAGKNKPVKAMEMITKCGELATRMVGESDKLIKEADALLKVSHNALVEAEKNYVGSEEKKKAIIDRTNKVKQDVAEQKKKSEYLVKDLQETKTEEAGHGDRAKEIESSYWGLGFIVCGKSAREARKRESNAREQRVKMQEETRKVNAELVRNIEYLKTSSSLVVPDELEQSITGLQIAVQTMGKVRTVFQNTKLFWANVRSKCDSLRTIDAAEVYADPEDFDCDGFIDEVKQAGICWLTLGKINREAALAIQGASVAVNGVMSNLPSKEEAAKMIAGLAATILGDIEEENKMIASLCDIEEETE